MSVSVHSPVKLVILTGSDTMHESVVRELEDRGYTSKSSAESGAAGPARTPPSRGDSDHDVDCETVVRLMMRDISRHTVVIVRAADGSRTTECRSTRVKPETFPTLSEIEHAHILTALQQSGWNCKRAAKLLGIDRSTLYRKIKRYALKQP